ncbi:MAG: hypothetical protein JWN36_2276 [Microbacteriaceae bacterium]|jgi:hypothetical protein|nr:hypothetical protein [Microbacteriaceae bacterium]
MKPEFMRLSPSRVTSSPVVPMFWDVCAAARPRSVVVPLPPCRTT